MKVNIDTSVSGNWAKAGKDIKDGDRLKIMDAGQVVEGKFGEQWVFKVMTIRKEEFNLALNRTSRNNLGKGFGTETDYWAGKVAKAFVVRQMIDGSLKNVLYLAPEDWTMNDDGEFINPKEEVPDVIAEALGADEIPF